MNRNNNGIFQLKAAEFNCGRCCCAHFAGNLPTLWA